MIYSSIVQLRNWLFDSGFRKNSQVPCPVVAIGNLTVGGTGKSPVTMALVKSCLDRGLRPGIVSRGYGRKIAGSASVAEVIPHHQDAARIYGDEPVMMKLKFPNVPILVGASRVQAANSLLANHQVDVIFADDAFQHRSLHRDIDIVLLDATTEQNRYRYLPFGRGREPFSSLGRAQFVVLTKVNLASPESLRYHEDVLEKYAGHAKVIRAASEVTVAGLVPESRVLAFSGLANNQNFFKSIQSQIRIVQSMEFPDHHVYLKTDIAKLVQLGSDFGITDFVTTEKDAVKLRGQFPTTVRLWTAELVIKFDENIKDLENEINQLAR